MFLTDQPFHGSRLFPAAVEAVGTSGIVLSAISEVSIAF